MCGISGVFHFENSKQVREQELTKMRETLVHRGPDGAANYISPDGKIGLSQRRLAIIDLNKNAGCPMSNENGTIWITYNGEIYNFKILREELKKSGYKFKTEGDTEVILYGYEKWGPEILKKLNGMFAFVIWDEKKKILFAARDHVGIKPFYYAIQNGVFYFGSETKAILAHPDFKKDLDENGVSHYLTFGSTPAPYTLFKDVKKLTAAHYLILQNGKIETKEYWTPVTTNNEQRTMDESDYISQVRALLRDSIESQMVSDVPFGCFLSGGIDSSTNAALMSRTLGKPVETFSVGYKGFNGKNEFEYSGMVAKKLGSKNHEILLDESHLRNFLPHYGFHADDPNADPVCFPLFWLSKLTKDSGVTVIQIGEGADEIFAGYEQYKKFMDVQKKYDLIEKFFTPENWNESFFKRFGVWRLLSRAVSFLGSERAQRLMSGERSFWGLAEAFGNYTKDFDLAPTLKNATFPKSDRIVEKFYENLKNLDKNADYLKQMTYIDLKHRLPEFLLARADKMTMAHSIEERVPFLDKRLVELVFNMPTELKTKNNIPKYILKKAVEGIIPGEIINRRKQGFSNPIGEWLKPESKVSKELTDIIFNSKLRERNILNYDYVRKLIDEHQNRNKDQHFKIWTLITLSLWYDYWFVKS